MLRAMHATRQWCRERSCSRRGSSLRKGIVEATGAGQRGGCEAAARLAAASRGHIAYDGVDVSGGTDVTIFSKPGPDHATTSR